MERLSINRDEYPLTAKAYAYAEAVLSGERPANKYEKLAVQRFANDLDKAAKGWDYYFSLDAAERVLRCVQNFSHYKGPMAGKKLIMEGWQCFIIANVFGWLKVSNNKRRFKNSYVEVPRGNGKSTMTSPIGLYMLSLDGESGAEVYSAATTRDQARIVFRDAQFMARAEPKFLARFGVEVHAHTISQLRTGSKFEPLSADGKTLDGLNIHAALIDELHAHPSRDVYDVLETGCGKRDQSLMWMITTAGSNLAGICMEVRTYLTKILTGAVEDDATFGIIYTIDEGDDPFILESWIKANPNYGVSVMPHHIEQLAKKAKETPSAINNFLTKHVNVWVNADSPWLDMVAWNKCADTELKLEQFEGEECYVGLDLATKTDIAAKMRCFVRMHPQEQRPHYYLFGEYYLPSAAVYSSKNSQYAGWEIEGLLTVTHGEVNDFSLIEDGVRADRDVFDLREVAFDPWGSTQMAQNLVEDGIEMIEFRMTTANFSEPMKQFDALVREGRIHHDGNPVLTWMMSNVVVHEDANENIFPRKQYKDNKIDGAVASIMALARAMFSEAEGGQSIYDLDGDDWDAIERALDGV